MIDLNYLKYSGASIIITVNPFHWAWFPNIKREKELVWDSDTFKVSVLFLTVRLWIDNGDW